MTDLYVEPATLAASGEQLSEAAASLTSAGSGLSPLPTSAYGAILAGAVSATEPVTTNSVKNALSALETASCALGAALTQSAKDYEAVEQRNTERVKSILSDLGGGR